MKWAAPDAACYAEETRASLLEGIARQAKFWLEPVVELARNRGLSDRELRRIRKIIDERRGEIQDAWNRHFGG